MVRDDSFSCIGQGTTKVYFWVDHLFKFVCLGSILNRLGLFGIKAYRNSGQHDGGGSLVKGRRQDPVARLPDEGKVLEGLGIF